jgi:hypothetical protein
MIYNLVSSKRILSKIYRDLKPRNSNWEADAIEWIGEALSFIGYQAAFVKRRVTLTVKDYRVPFPKDFYNLIAVYYEDNKLPFGGDIVNAEPYLDEAIYIAAKTEVLESTNFTVTRYGSRLYNTGSSDYNYYTINPGYIQTSFETDDIELVYNAWPVDKEGLPLIPDSPYYSQAIEWYVMRQMSLQGYEFPNKEFTFTFLDQQWKHYCVSAGNDAAFPNPDKAQRFMDMWVHLIPDINIDFDNIVTKDTHETI